MVLKRNLRLRVKTDHLIFGSTSQHTLRRIDEVVACSWVSKLLMKGCGMNGTQTNRIDHLGVNLRAVLDETWQRHLHAINPYVIFSSEPREASVITTCHCWLSTSSSLPHLPDPVLIEILLTPHMSSSFPLLYSVTLFPVCVLSNRHLIRKEKQNGAAFNRKQQSMATCHLAI